jgi:signal transduction histidine kinase
MSRCVITIIDVLDVSQLEGNTLTLRPVPTALHVLADDLRNLAAASALQLRRHQLTITADVSSLSRSERWVLVDANRLRQILINLLNNAVKFTEHGRIALTIEIVRGDSESHTTASSSSERNGLRFRRNLGTSSSNNAISHSTDVISVVSTAAELASKASTAGTGAKDEKLSADNTSVGDQPDSTVQTYRFTIRDSGVGLSADVKTRMFQAFTQFNSNMPGAGLGLYM